MGPHLAKLVSNLNKRFEYHDCLNPAKLSPQDNSMESNINNMSLLSNYGNHNIERISRCIAVLLADPEEYVLQ